MKYTTIIIALFSILTTTSGQAVYQEKFHFNNGTIDDARVVTHAFEGHIVTAGITEKHYEGEPHNIAVFVLYTLKTDANGGTVWKHIYPLEESNHPIVPESIEPTYDGGYLIAGNVFMNESETEIMVLLKINSNGGKEWSMLYDCNIMNEFLTPCWTSHLNHVFPTLDGGYIAIATIELSNEGDWEDLQDHRKVALVFTTNHNGVVSNAKTFSTSLYSNENKDYDEGLKIYQIGGGYLALLNHRHQSNNQVYGYPIALKLDYGLNTTMSKSIQYEDLVLNAVDLVTLSEGNFAILGQMDYNKNGFGSGQLFINKMNDNGSLQWARRYYFNSPSDANQLSPLALAKDHNDNLYTAGWTYALGGYTGFAFKADSDGSPQWLQQYWRGPKSAQFRDIAYVISDHYIYGEYFVAVGQQYHGPNTGNRSYAVKASAYNGTTICDHQDSTLLTSTPDYQIEDIELVSVDIHLTESALTIEPENPSRSTDFCSETFEDAPLQEIDQQPALEIGYSSNDNLHISPNPSTGQVTITLPDNQTENTILEIYNPMGQQVVRYPLQGIRTDLSLESLPSGTYLFRVASTKSSWQKKVVLQ